ncbi:hypothetical protein Tco_0655411 [Tanacetum coccineum]|uniref:Reverse transcriptase domain-containing protein n=1 Tax=Tanacetum coccineum TaxID=301880 RepID=A0ABQ4X727_9ASTR
MNQTKTQKCVKFDWEINKEAAFQLFKAGSYAVHQSWPYQREAKISSQYRRCFKEGFGRVLMQREKGSRVALKILEATIWKANVVVDALSRKEREPQWDGGLQVDDKLHFVEEPIEIMDREVKQLRQSRVLIVKVRWNSRRGPEFTWEREDQFRKKYPHLFTKTAPSSSAMS